MSKRHSSSMNVHVLLCVYYLLIWSSIVMPSYVQSQSDPRYLIIITITTLMDDEVELEGNHHNKVSLSLAISMFMTGQIIITGVTGQGTVQWSAEITWINIFLDLLQFCLLFHGFSSSSLRLPVLSMIVFFFFSRAAIMSSLFDKRY